MHSPSRLFLSQAAEYAACGCALVAVRRVEATDFFRRKCEEYEERFPSFNFVEGLEEIAPQLSAAR